MSSVNFGNIRNGSIVTVKWTDMPNSKCICLNVDECREQDNNGNMVDMNKINPFLVFDPSSKTMHTIESDQIISCNGFCKIV